jgi:hypothetical protein
MRENTVMYPQSTVDIALRLSVVGVLDQENARICGVSVATIRHWRCGRRRIAHNPRATAERLRQCPRCHGRTMDEAAYSYLLGLYLGDGHITSGRRNVFVLSLFCSDDWPGLLAAARSTLAAVCPHRAFLSSTAGMHGGQEHLQALALPVSAAWAWTEAHSENRARAMAICDCAQTSWRIRKRAIPLRWLAWR